MSFTQTPPTSNSFLESTETIFSTPVGMRPVQANQPGAYVQPVPPLPEHPHSDELPLSFDVPGQDLPQEEPSAGSTTWGLPAENSPQYSSAPVQPEEDIAPVDLSVLKELQQATKSELSTEALAVSKGDLAGILEGFARVLRGEGQRTEITAGDRSSEISQMKELLLEAQETIITLLNDRVFDRAKIARLEAEVRLLPDLQAQAHRAMGLAMRSEDFQKELSDVRSEMERLRASYVRSESVQISQTFWDRMFGRRKG